MAKKKQKYYVVWEGHEAGIYPSWKECQRQIQGYSGAKYKSYPTLKAAEDAYAGSYYQAIANSPKKKPKPTVDIANATPPIWNSLAVDAACSGNPGKMEYQGVQTNTGKRLFHVGPLEHGTNNIGEFLALVHGLAFLQQAKLPLIPIYTDSKIAMGWVKAKKCRTKVQKIAKNKVIFELIARAEKWLKTNSYQNPIIKWDTKVWGEIPADFGRK